MLFWIICAVLTALGVAVLSWPLLRSGASRTDGDSIEVAIYRDQLQEIERDLERNLINAEEAESAKLEVSRRLLAADEMQGAKYGSDNNGKTADKFYERIAFALASVVIILTMGGYLVLGQPGLPGQPHAERLRADLTKVPVSELVARVEARLQKNPNDARGWDVIAPVYLRREEYAKAAQAFQIAIRLNGESERRLAQFAEAMLGVSSGEVTEAIVQVYQRLLVLRPEYIPAQFWLNIWHEQQNETEQAVQGYRKLLARSDVSPAMRQVIATRLTQLGGKAPPAAAVTETEPGALASTNEGKGAAPSREAREHMAQLTAEERQNRIEAMVDGLASRLREDGGEVSEWQRLIRALRVLGKEKDAQQAYTDALQAFQDNPLEIKKLEALAGQLGLTDIVK